MDTVMWAIILCGLLSIVYGAYTVSALMAADAGTPRMREIAAAIQEGAQAYLTRQYSMPVDVVRVRRFFDPRRPIHHQVAGHANGNWKAPVLVGIEHESARLADAFP